MSIKEYAAPALYFGIMLWLGGKRGYLTDWATQQWVKITGTAISPQSATWLEGPKGRPTGIGADFFERFAAENQLTIQPGVGLVRDFHCLDSASCSVARLSPAVVHFYEHTAEYELEAWSQWCGWFRPFGRLLALIFSRRLQQLNLPLSSLDTSRGISSDVIDLVDKPTGAVQCTAWVRQLLSSRDVLYAGSYSTCSVPGFSGRCVKVVFPLPNGNAIVIMKPESHRDGSFSLTSSGARFGHPGFYFTVHDGHRVWARYVRAMQETIHVYASGENDVRADHELRLWGSTFLRLHYRLRPRASTQSNVAGQTAANANPLET